MERTTRKQLEAAIERLNKALGLPIAAYTEHDGRYRANIGNLHLDHNIGGWRVEQICSDGGGVTAPFGDYRCSAGECWQMLRAALGAVQLAQERAKLQEAE